ncbi:MAG: hypothetical protein IMZ46_04330 [Acidobacteria bacterium]|nr:hypothetical protein [Acidobacteriota bacterium]
MKIRDEVLVTRAHDKIPEGHGRHAVRQPLRRQKGDRDTYRRADGEAGRLESLHGMKLLQ